jgi:hypothetical protein
MLSYVGNGVGISGFLIEPSGTKPFSWWEIALFGEAADAIQIQLKNMCPFIPQKQRGRIITKILAATQVLEYDNDS